MKIPALLFRLCLVSSVCLAIVSAAVLETNVAPADAAAQSQPVQVIVPGLDELREQLRTVQRSNEQIERNNEETRRASQEASQKFEAMTQQNTALSNVLAGLQQTLITQKERE